jgi:hypothetical protein
LFSTRMSSKSAPTAWKISRTNSPLALMLK